ncbi:DUF2938 domain-containing protein [Acinetobacter junii]|uniref:DUF2938 domain-containing protein n=1 Tax=Acinetobacter junii TaxID=40215 RepID=UPI00102E65AB|nr:DUF2938 domain-containing protein [Acinetobacter junii]RZG65472.1 DUF2938 domain-containing protein [Acinetobacter junii]
MNVLERLIYIFGLGIGATIIMDIWLLILKRFNIPTLNFALLGRWVGWILRGKIQHQSISQSPEIRHEYLLGWIAHYSVGVIFSFSFILMVGQNWLAEPQFPSALSFGVITVLIPFLIMQPAMGLGIAASKTPQPFINRIKSLINHIIFGCGLFLTAALFNFF